MSNFNYILNFFLPILFCVTNVYADKNGELNVYNWSEYVSSEDLTEFQQKYNIKLNYSLYDSDYILESKLISGKTGYDIVFPSLSPFLARQIKLDLYQKIDKTKLKNYKNIDKKFLKIMEQYDLNNDHAIPWIWSSIGIGYNIEKLNDIFPGGFPRSLDLIFKKEFLEKIAPCGIAILDSPSDIIPLMLLYEKVNPNSEGDQVIKIIEKLLKNIKNYVTYFHTSKYIDDLSNGEVCVALGYSTDIFQAANASKEKFIGYFIPEEGSVISIDTIGILKDAKNVENAYKFIDFILQPQVSARITNKHHYANTNKMSLNLVNKEILNNKNIFLDEKDFSKLHSKKEINSDEERKRTRIWMRIISENP